MRSEEGPHGARDRGRGGAHVKEASGGGVRAHARTRSHKPHRQRERGARRTCTRSRRRSHRDPPRRSTCSTGRSACRTACWRASDTDWARVLGTLGRGGRGRPRGRLWHEWRSEGAGAGERRGASGEGLGEATRRWRGRAPPPCPTRRGAHLRDRVRLHALAVAVSVLRNLRSQQLLQRGNVATEAAGPEDRARRDLEDLADPARLDVEPRAHPRVARHDRIVGAGDGEHRAAVVVVGVEARLQRRLIARRSRLLAGGQLHHRSGHVGANAVVFGRSAPELRQRSARQGGHVSLLISLELASLRLKSLKIASIPCIVPLLTDRLISITPYLETALDTAC